MRADAEPAAQTKGSHDCSPAVVVDDPNDRLRRSVCGDPNQVANVGEAGPDLARPGIECKPHARHHHSFHPAFQDRRQPAPPGRIDEDQRIDTADQVGGCLYERIEDWFIALVRLPLGFAHRRPEPLGVEVNDIDAVSGNLEAGDGTLGEGVGVAVSTGVRENDGGMHVVIVADVWAQRRSQSTATSSRSDFKVRN